MKLNPSLHSAFDRIIKIICFLFLINALMFCVHNYLTFRSLWLDEAFVAVNIRFRDFFHLFQPLEYSQQFPRFYLALIWGLTKIFSYDVWVLRLLPFVFSLAGIILWSKILWGGFSKSSIFFQAFVVLLFIGNSIPYNFAGDLKQYTGDMFFSAFCIWMALSVLREKIEKPFGSWWYWGLIWSLPILFSYIYVVVLAAAGIALFVESPLSLRLKIKKSLPLLGLVGVILSISFLIDMQYSPAGMKIYWNKFFIQGNTTQEWIHSFLSANKRLLGDWWLEKASLGLVLVSYCGVIGLFFKHRSDDRVFIARTSGFVLIGLLLLGIFKIYPIHADRLDLFFLPMAAALFVNGLIILSRVKFFPIRIIGYGLSIVVLSWLLVRRMPELNRHIYFGTHWENINPALKLLDYQKSTHVVYGSGTVAQVRAHPSLPANFEFIGQNELQLDIPIRSGRTPWLEGDFYYLMATPNSEPEELAVLLNRQFPVHVEKLDKHLFYYTNKK